jgi:hypothetical protein
MSRAWLCLVAVAAAATLACSEPPTKEFHQAEGAIAAARAADAATYAPDELKTAEDALARYDAAVAQHDYRQALSLAIEARDGAYDAAKRAGNEKAAARGEAERLLGELESLVRTAEARLAGPPRPPAATAARLRTAVQSAQATLQEARTHVDAQQFQPATTALTAEIQRVREILDLPAATGTRRGR